MMKSGKLYDKNDTINLRKTDKIKEKKKNNNK